MLATALKVKRAEVAPLIEATFPEYRGRTFKVRAAKKVGLWNLNWCEGSRSQYRTCTQSGDKVGGADKYNHTAPWANMAEGREIEIPRGAVVVEHAICCGKDCGLTFYIHPEDMPKLIGAR